MTGRLTDGGAGAAAHVHHPILSAEPGDLSDDMGCGTAPEDHGHRVEDLNRAAGLLGRAGMAWLRSGTSHGIPLFAGDDGERVEPGGSPGRPGGCERSRQERRDQEVGEGWPRGWRIRRSRLIAPGR